MSRSHTNTPYHYIRKVAARVWVNQKLMLKIEIYVFSAFLPSFIIQYVHIHAVGYVHCSPYGEFNMEIYYTCFWLLPFIIISSSPNWFMCITFWFDCTLPNMLYGCSCWWNFTDLHVHFLSPHAFSIEFEIVLSLSAYICTCTYVNLLEAHLIFDDLINALLWLWK